jgi:hypothetical protein
LGNGVIDGVRVQSQSVGRLLTHGDPVAGAKVSGRAARDEAESLMVLVEHFGDDLCAIVGKAAMSLVCAFRR